MSLSLMNQNTELVLKMASSSSPLSLPEKDEDKHEKRRGEILYDIDFYVLPEGCIAAVVSFTGPRDACRFSSISKVFKSAADSDAVWEHFLPSDYRDILARSSDGSALSLLDSLSKKDLFLRLADTPLLIDDGDMSFSLEKSTGKKCFTIAARNLAITWGDTPRYWAWNSVPESSRFSEVAELVTVCWLEIIGKLKTSLLSPNTDYAAYLVFKMTSEAYGFYSPAEVVLRTPGGKVETGNVYLDSRDKYQIVPRRMFNRSRAPPTRAPTPMPLVEREREDDAKLPKQRGDGWLEIKIGEFSTLKDEEGEVEMSVLEVKAGNWKGGMRVEGIEIRPKKDNEPKMDNKEPNMDKEGNELK
ncbi:putative F-box protein PP2-B12 [Bienertia sinuspersici]